MTWKAVFETATGKLRSVGTVVADPLPEGLSVVDLAGRPDGAMLWNEATQAFDVPAPAPVLTWSRTEFLELFTAAERLTIRELTKTVPAMDDYLFMVQTATTIRSDHALVTDGLAALVAGGIITQARADAIAAGEKP
ncbi:hypothetical protein [Seohaeicola zhoushanensis]|uniref:Uncharacterized protein n=1 Tax=Seohaeicola zhoushanensis TaxID=1569283 RepID=A0A8J3MAZ0_9RHOB|nr:hypothetical protein [Seohaeicola zhoushanensis]GHF71299.1 hypothetical protein GCM10017056_47780 [Seohaeicola zhoushanensis]